VRTADGPQILYADDAASVLIAGRVFDAKTGRNLTEERERQLTAVDWKKLPWQWAITSKRGDGRAIAAGGLAPRLQRAQNRPAPDRSAAACLGPWKASRDTWFRRSAGNPPAPVRV